MQRARTDQAKDKRRNALLRAALDEFYECGFSAARMEDIARRADLSKGTVYLYFNSKEALFNALIESLTQPNIQQIEAIAQEASTIAGAIQAFAKFAPVMIRHSDVPRLMKVLIGESNTFPKIVRKYRRDVLDRVLAVITARLIKGAAAGEISVTDPALTARLVIAPIAFSAIWQVVFASDADAAVDLDALFQLHADMLMQALASKGVS